MANKNAILAIAQKEDHTRLRLRMVKPEKGKGRKNRPRQKKFYGGVDLFMS